MKYYYTQMEGGLIKPLPLRTRPGKVARQLFRHRNKGLYGYYSFVSMPSTLPYRVKSVFFVSRGRLDRIWDADLNGYKRKGFKKIPFDTIFK